MCQADPHTTARTLCGLTAEFILGAENSVWYRAYWQYGYESNTLASTEDGAQSAEVLVCF